MCCIPRGADAFTRARRTRQRRARQRLERSVPWQRRVKRTHRAYSVIRREGQDDFWFNFGLVLPHKDGGGVNIMLDALPLDGKIVCREITEGGNANAQDQPTPR